MRGARPRSPGWEAEGQNTPAGDSSTRLPEHCAALSFPLLVETARRGSFLADFRSLDPEPKSGKVSFSLASSIEEQLGGVYSEAGMRLDASFLQIILRSFVSFS